MSDQKKSEPPREKDLYLAITVVATTILLIITGLVPYFNDSLLDFPWNIGIWLFMFMLIGAFFDSEKEGQSVTYSMLKFRYRVMQWLYYGALTILVVIPFFTGFMDKYEGTLLGFPYNIIVIVIGFVVGGVLQKPHGKHRTAFYQRAQEMTNNFYRRINTEYRAEFSSKNLIGNKHMSAFFDVKNRKVLFRQATTGWEMLKSFEDIRSCEAIWTRKTNRVGSTWNPTADLRIHLRDVDVPVVDVPTFTEDLARYWSSKVEAMVLS